MNAWVGHRSPRWIVEHLDKSDEPLGQISEWSGGSVKIAAFSTLGGDAAITLSEPAVFGDRPINFHTDRLRFSYDPGIRGVDPVGMGVYIFESTNEEYGETVEYPVSLLPKTAVLDQDIPLDTYSLAAGTPIIPAVIELIQSTGETRIAATDSAAALSSDFVADLEWSKLTICNELLTAAGYSPVWCDGEGQFRLEPYLEPRQRPIVWTFEDGETSIYMPEWSREHDILSIPNRVKVRSSGSDEEPPIIGIAENNDPDDPTSIPARGRIVGRSEESSDFASQAAATAYAQRLLTGGQSPVATLSVTHAIVPLDPHDLIRFVHDGVERHATVREMSFDMTYDADCKALWREVQYA